MVRTTTTSIIISIVLGIFLCVGVEGAEVTLAWDTNPETDIEGYYIYYGTNEMERIDVGTSTSVTLTNLVVGVRYTVYATAVNELGMESEPSAMLYYTPQGAETAPRMSLLSEDGELVVTASGQAQQTFTLQSTTSLSPAEWETVETIVIGDQGTARVSLPGEATDPRRFYRLLQD